VSTTVAPARAAQHPWAIVAPWWKWPDPAATAGGRLTHPELLKYETSKLVDEFIKDPQRNLQWVDEDLVHIVQTAAAAGASSNGKPRRFSDLEYVIDPLRTRKIFLDTHKRFYLVVCQLHCDAPGFPRADRADVCEAGFVVRRRTTDIPTAGAKEVSQILKKIGKARSTLGTIEAHGARARAMVPASAGSSMSQSGAMAMAGSTVITVKNAIVSEARTTTLERQRASTRALLDLERVRLMGWVAQFGVAPQLQGWFPDSSLDKVGAWAAVDEKPEEITGEATFPMYPLIPPRNDLEHAGSFGTIFFGLLPTGTGETDSKGVARFEDQHYYEVTCFAERHSKPHDRGSPCACPGSLFWSLPTEPYRLAAHFDVAGTAKRPVTVQLPDLDALAAQAAPTFGVAFAKPPNSLMITGTIDGKPIKRGRTSGFEICSFSIPLITIVASFVFELFLPVVVLLFGLWFLLKLKFCIPPEVNLAAGVTAELSLNMSAAAEANIAASVNASIDANYGAGTEIAAGLETQFAPIAVANLEVALAAASVGNGPDLSDNVQFMAEVRHP
jgi:hypothetical protein